MLSANVLWIFAGFAAWAVLHSLTASQTAKDWFAARFAARYCRLLYNGLAFGSLLPVWLLTQWLPDSPLYQLPKLWLWVTIPIQALALLGACWALWQADIWHFAGLRQLQQIQPQAHTPLQKRGLYAWVRHPLYTCSLLLLWLMPSQSANSITFAFGCSVYFWLGSWFEERKLLQAFGDSYAEYQKQVPRLLPGLKFLP